MKLNPIAILLVGLATAGAFLLTSGSSTHAYEDQLLAVAVHQSFGNLAPKITQESPEIQALLLDYADNEPLLLQTRLALLSYPDLAHRILPTYGDEPEFQEVLLIYGEAALPTIAYFMNHDLTSLEIRRTMSEWMAQIKLLHSQRSTAGEQKAPPDESTESDSKLTAEERGWYAIHFLLEEGYDLLGQFAVSPDGTIEWVQTERVMEGISDFFFGGIRDLEAKWRQEDKIGGSDLGWAALDVVVIAGSIKLLKAFRTVKAARPAAATASTGGFSGRVAVFGSRILARGGRLGVSIAKFGAIPAAVYLMIRYPSLINATLAEFAGWLGIDPWLMQFLFWFLAISIALSMTALLLRPLSRVFRGMSWLTGSLALLFTANRINGRHQQNAA